MKYFICKKNERNIFEILDLLGSDKKSFEITNYEQNHTRVKFFRSTQASGNKINIQVLPTLCDSVAQACETIIATNKVREPHIILFQCYIIGVDTNKKGELSKEYFQEVSVKDFSEVYLYDFENGVVNEIIRPHPVNIKENNCSII
jgi:hypothetical protein